jgi:hypothetical protein
MVAMKSRQMSPARLCSGCCADCQSMAERGRAWPNVAEGLVRFTLSLLLAACGSTGPEDSAIWGSSQASLTVSESGATLQILASGGCYGSYGEITQPIPSSSFTLPGSYTQLTGVYPGHVTYEAQFTGAIARGMMTLTVSVPATQQTLGPFLLTHGEGKTWPACLYP